MTATGRAGKPGRPETGVPPRTANIFDRLEPSSPVERFETVLERPGVRLERIVSTGQSTPEGEWYDQAWDEWVILLAGSAGLLLAGDQEPVTLAPGDYVYLPAHCRHRVAWTSPDEPTVWLAIHLGGPDGT